MKSVSVLAVGCATLVALTGCVSKSKYDALLARNMEQQVKIKELGQRADQMRLTTTDLQAQLKSEREGLTSAQGGTQSREQQIGILTQRAADLETQVQDLVDELSKPLAPIPEGEAVVAEPLPVVLPADVAKALEDFAAGESDVTFDRSAGRCRFASDVLFDKGTDIVKPELKAVLKRFAAIFTSVGRGCHLSVEGHTDSQRISNTGTRAKHPTNWHLSVHRAIEVMRVLYKAGIDQDRFTVVGFGSERPIADNRTADGRARNRRVEILVTVPGAGVDRTARTPAVMGGE